MFFQNFIKINHGRWMTLRTIYIPSSSSIYVHQSQVDVKPHLQNKYIVELDSLDQRNQLYIIHHYENHKGTNLFHNFGHRNDLPKHIHYFSEIQKLSNFRDFLNKTNYFSSKYQIRNLTINDKVWLVNPNLRLNISIVYKSNQCVCIAFGSDIKIA
uniref:Uncharacterized protein n=1 Tax=Liagoropsis maxima TaxID=1653392 RepID=A0A1G4NVN0_9FLOR|nr:Hypothetical protein ycf58 [Liagoropsis maxima]SCW22763.1 Hypothetical protein ycf58 [Liagoropsis maxima]